MKILAGYTIIFLSHYLLGVIFNSSFFDEPDYSYLIEYFILIVIGLPNCILSINSSKRHLFTYWIIFSTLPGLLFMTYARFQDNSGGLISFPWDWALWFFVLPAVYTIVQVIFILYFLGNRLVNSNITASEDNIEEEK